MSYLSAAYPPDKPNSRVSLLTNADRPTQPSSNSDRFCSSCGYQL
ncbi:MAG: hypothetical protein WBA93_28240 [Microcoleaceae cyanobacterium]